MNEQRLASLQLRAFNYVVIHREECLRERCSLVYADAIRNRQALHRRRSGIFCVASTRQQCANGCAAERRSNIRATADDFTGDLEAWYVGGARGGGLWAFSRHNVGPIPAGRRDADQHFAWANCGNRSLHGAQDLRRSGLGDLDRRHVARDVCHDGDALYFVRS